MAVVASCTVRSVPAGVEGAAVRFTDVDRETIKTYYERFTHPPELLDPDALAPSLEERLAISASVPPETAAMPLPVELQQSLSSLPPGYERFRIGSEVVLMDVRTRQVVDVIILIFGGFTEN